MRRPCVRSIVAACALLATAVVDADEASYLRDVKPLFVEKCSSCHGPLKQEASLRLDSAALIRKGGDSGPAAAPGEFEASLLFERVTAEDLSIRMPPEGEGEALTPEQLERLSQWVASGMPAPANEEPLPDPSKHWAFQSLDREALVREWSGELPTIDQAIEAKLAAAGIEPFPEADRATLLRRVYFDLIGLPPTRDELHAFLADDSPDAFERVVDRLLEDPRYGERWGRRWMDVWRYSDWIGYGNELREGQRHIWRWRDWIVGSLNEDKPYDRMVVEMLAGDEIAPGDPSVLAATGFLARNYHNLNRDMWLDATSEHTAKAFLGLTINCAKCHDHKFDPVAQTEYYAWRAIFEPHRVRTDRVPGETDVMKNGVPRAYDADMSAPTYVYLRGDEKQPDKDRPIPPAVPNALGASLTISPVDLPPIAVFPALADHVERDQVRAAEERLAAATAALEEARRERTAAQEASFEPTVDDEAKVAESASKRSDAETKILRAELARAESERNLESLKARFAADRAKHDPALAASEEDRKALATAASAAERRHAASVAELERFDKEQAFAKALASAEPDEKKRTDAIAKAKAEHEAALKKRDEALANVEKTDTAYTTVGEAYPATSSGRRLALGRWITAKENPLAARVAVNHVWMRHFGKPLVETAFDFGVRTPRPVQADVLDTLAIEFMESGWSLKSLHRRIVTSRAWRRSSSEPNAVAPNKAPGPDAVDPDAVDPDNALLWRQNVRRLEAEPIRDALLYVAGELDATMGGPDLDSAQGERVYRRSLYFRHAREKQMKLLTTFDGASPDDCYRRAESVVPQQALAIANGELSRTMSRLLARRLSTSADAPVEDGAFVDAAFEAALGRSPTDEERAASIGFLAEQKERLTRKESLTSIGGATTAKVAASDDPSLRARESLCHVLFTHNDFVAVR